MIIIIVSHWIMIRDFAQLSMCNTYYAISPDRDKPCCPSRVVSYDGRGLAQLEALGDQVSLLLLLLFWSLRGSAKDNRWVFPRSHQ